MKSTCLKCSKYLTCRDPQKHPRYSCDDFKRIKTVDSILELDEMQLVPSGSPADIIMMDEPPTSKSKVIQIQHQGPSTGQKVQGPEVLTEDEYDEEKMGADFVWQAMQKAYDPLTNSVRDLRVDDSELAQAKNYFDFCASVAGKSIKTPFARQLWIAMNLMGECCPYCTPKKWFDIDNVPVDMDVLDLVKKVTFYVKGVCPKCKSTRASAMIAKDMFDYNQLVMVAGQRAGKSAFTVTLVGYHVHLMLKAPRLSTICRGIQDFTPLTGTFVALTTGRAIKLLWNPFKALVDNSQWFQDYFQNLDDYGNKYGKEFYKKGALFMRVHHRNLDMYPVGPMKRTLRGDTRFLACLAGHTKVLTAERGWVRIDDKSLIGLHAVVDDQENKITAWYEQGVKPVFNICLSNGAEVTATADHLFMVYNFQTRRTEMQRVDKMQQGSVLVCEVSRGVANNGTVQVNGHDLQLEEQLRLQTIEPEHPFFHSSRRVAVVRSIQTAGEQKVYDISIDSKDHLFNANGFVSHNCTDELGLFPFRDIATSGDEDDPFDDGSNGEDEREMANGDEVHQSLDNSLSTIRTEVWDLYRRGISTIPTGYNINISSPFSWRDKIMRLLKESENKETLSFGVRLPTWEVNPLYSRDHPVITSAYAKNPRRAERDFGANPPKLSENSFRKDVLLASFKGKQHHSIRYDESDPTRTVGNLVELLTKARWLPSVMGLDAGFTNNSFALTFGSRLGEVIEAYSVIELMPTAAAPISFPRLYRNVILPIIKECNVVYLGADRWNSVNLLQQVEEDTKGLCQWIHMTINNDHFKQFSELVNSGNLILPELSWDSSRVEEVHSYRSELRHHPVEHLLLQFMTVQNKNGVLVKGDGQTDDLFRSLVVMATMHFVPKVRDYVSKCEAKDRDFQSKKAMTFVSGRSSIWTGQNVI